MTFDENGADREPPQLGGFFIENFFSAALCVSSVSSALKRII
jgi:hypothetical protein